ncbi:PAS domain-containing sensor histidine kinase [Sphingomonas montanisoli]|uniref:histidine kinase n=1 Tax=Sphingomonas montanisoli TaxID=2606412 RepID=A0A5D9C877_9SPHN|nr:PAS domain S-box protein [Sphingomonas montanisoli]TZG26285.1 PAS domain S-box protein [Sphingomonas montanisoli]
MAARLSAVASGTCVLLGGAVLVGWVAGEPRVATLGLSRLATPPVVAASAIALAVGLIARLFDAPRASRILIVVGVLLACLPTIAPILNIDGMIDRSVNAFLPSPDPPRLATTRIAAILILLMLAAASWPDSGRGGWPAKVAVVLATIVLLFSATVVIGHVIGIELSELGPRTLLLAAPGALIFATLAGAILIWRHGDGWPGYFAIDADTAAIEGWHLPGIIIAVAVAQILLHAAAQMAHLHPAMIDAAVVVLNVAIATAIVGRAAERSARNRAERDALVDTIDLAPVMVVGQDGIIRYWSHGCTEIYGWTAKEAIGRRRDELLASISISNEDGVEVERVELHRDGHELVIFGQARAVTMPGQSATTVIALTDITARRAAESAVRLRDQAIAITEARLATAVAVQGIFIYEYDLVAERLRWSTGDQALFHGSLGREDNPRGLSNRVADTLGLAIDQRQVRVHFEMPFDDEDGLTRHAESWARIIYDDDGKALRVIGTYLDVTDRIAREHALRAAEAEMRAILATMPDALVVCDEHGVIRSASAAADVLYGCEPGGLIGIEILSIGARPADGSSKARSMAELVDDSRRWPGRITFRRFDGEEVPVLATVSETIVDDRCMFVISGRDMRPAIEAEGRLVRLRSQLDQVSRAGMMGELAAALAHEINQPLAAIVNFLGAADIMLGEDERHQPAIEAIRHASEQASRAGEIIRRLRAFITRGEIDMRPEPIVALAEEATALAMINRGSRDIRIRYAFEASSRKVMCDRLQIQQVLVNLIRNGADAMAADGGMGRDLIVSSTMRDDAMLVLSVRDHGPGIDPAMYEQLFRPFATTKREGMGFGLSISRRIVEAHGGTLSVVPADGGGSIFQFTLPVAGPVGGAA